MPAAGGALFAVAGAILIATGHAAFEYVAGTAALVFAIACGIGTVRVRRAHARPLITFDANGIAIRSGTHTTVTPWTRLRAGYAAPGSRRFVVLLLPLEGTNDAPLALPGTTEFRAHELLALVRAYGGALSS